MPGEIEEIFTREERPRGKRLTEQERKQLQHELKIYMEQYFKKTLGKSVEKTKVNIWEDILVIRGEGFLTEPEKFISKTARGREAIRKSRMHVVHQHIADNVPYFEEVLCAQAIHHAYEVEAENDFWMHIIVFDRLLTE